MITQHIDIRDGSVQAEVLDEGDKHEAKKLPSRNIKQVLYFKHRTDPNDQVSKLSARYGQGLAGRAGMMVFFHRDETDPQEGLQMVDFPIWKAATFVRARPTKDKSALKKVVADLRAQANAARDLEDQETYVDDGDTVVLTIMKFGFSQEGLDVDSRLVTKHGVGINGTGGLVVFPDKNANLSIHPGWYLVKLGIRRDERFALARPCLDLAIIQDAISDLEKQLQRLEKTQEQKKERAAA